MNSEDDFIIDENDPDIAPLGNSVLMSEEDVLKSIQLKTENDEVLEPDIIEEKEIQKPSKPVKTKKETEIDKQAQDLMDDFGSYLEQKTDIKQSKEEKIVIPTGIKVLDAYLGGGFAVGTFGIIVGSPGSGKSMLAAQILANAQKMFNGQQFIAGYMDSEESTTRSRLAQLGVRNPQIKPYQDITIEKVFKFLETMCLYKESKKIIDTPSVVIWDSIANTLTEKEREATDINQVIGLKARVLSVLVPKFVSRVGKYNILWLAVNQLRDNLDIGMFAGPKDLKFLSSSKHMPGGNIVRYNAFQLVEMNVKSALKSDDGANAKYGIDGILARVKIVKNKLFVPNVEVEIIGSFISGFSDFWTSYKVLAESERLKTGAWQSLINFPEKKFRVKDAENLYNTDEQFRLAFEEQVSDYIQKDIIEKYAQDI